MEQPPIMCHTSRCSSKIIRAGKRHTSKSVISLLPTGNNVTDAPLTGNSYNIYKQDISEIDMYTHHPWWVNYIESLLGWQLGPDEYITSPIYRTCSLNSRKCGVPCQCHSRQTPNSVFRVLSIPYTLALKATSKGVVSPSLRLLLDYLWVLCPQCLFSLALLKFLTRLPNAVTACELYRICMQIKK